MSFPVLSWLLLTALAEDGLNEDRSLPRMSYDDVAVQQEPAPPQSPDRPPPRQQQPPPPPAPPQPAPERPERPELGEPPSPVTFSVNGRVPFPLGSARIGTFSGGSTVLGQRVRYDDLYKQNGWGGAVELSFLSTDWEEEDAKALRDRDHRQKPKAVDRHGSGFYLAGQFDRFGSEDLNLGGGQSIRTERINVETMFAGYKDHQPWGGGLFTEFRIGGGAIHYGPGMASFNTAGTSSRVELFRGSWGPAAELAGRVGLHLGGSTTLFVGGEAYAAQGPREGSGLPFTVNSNTFFAAAAEAGIQFGF
ncbi:MAG: hypothetical protein JO332_19810 [Planctomycetaceae bacterium]|nr:hypothetical protein [Planctomycetaceae bacterium]